MSTDENGVHYIIVDKITHDSEYKDMNYNFFNPMFRQCFSICLDGGKKINKIIYKDSLPRYIRYHGQILEKHSNCSQDSFFDEYIPVLFLEVE